MRDKIPEKLEACRVLTGYGASSPAMGVFGSFYIQGPCNQFLKIVSSGAMQHAPWEHVSVSCKKRTPNWPEMCFVKDMFWHENEAVAQFHPPKSDYVNYHPYCLHLWRPVHFPMHLPPYWMVGPRAGQTEEEARAEADKAMGAK